MKTFSISGIPRKTTGKKNTSSLRREGKVPCVLYGGKEHLLFSAPEKAFRKLVYAPDVHLVKLDVGGKQFDAIIKDIHFHPVTDSIRHADFLEVLSDKPVLMNIPVKLSGSPVGVKEGGKLLKKLPKLKIKGLISKIPGSIDLEVSEMKIGDSVKVKDLQYDGLIFLHEANATIVAVRIVKEVMEEVPATAAAALTGTIPAEGAAPATPGEPVPQTAPATAAPAKEVKKEEKKKK